MSSWSVNFHGMSLDHTVVVVQEGTFFGFRWFFSTFFSTHLHLIQCAACASTNYYCHHLAATQPNQFTTQVLVTAEPLVGVHTPFSKVVPDFYLRLMHQQPQLLHRQWIKVITWRKRNCKSAPKVDRKAALWLQWLERDENLTLC